MKLTVDLHNLKGTKTGTLNLPPQLFAAQANPTLVATAVQVYLFNQRTAQATTKNRGDVAYSKAKLYRQKGTGRARHGSRNAPIFVGGGSAHGPTGTQNYRRRLPQTLRQQALASTLTAKFKLHSIKFISSFDKFNPKTKAFAQIINQLGLKNSDKILIILEKPYPLLWRAAKNLVGVDLTQAKRLSAYEILAHSQIIITSAAVDTLTSHYQRLVKTKNL